MVGPQSALSGRRLQILSACAVGLNLLITIPLARILNVWVDEAYTLLTTGSTLKHAVGSALYFEYQPPFYFATLNLWRSLDHSIFFARLFSVLCVAITIYAAGQLSIRYLKGFNPAWALVAIAINPATIWAAEEIRVYALAGLLGALLLWTFYDGYLTEGQPRNSRSLYVILAIIAVYTQYFLGFLLAANLVAMLVMRRVQALRAYALGMIVVAIFCLPIAYVLRGQIASGTSTFASALGPAQLANVILSTLLSYILPLAWISAWYVLPIGFTAAAVIVVLAARRLQVEGRGLCAIAAVATICLFIGLAMTKEPFAPRYVYVLFIPLVFAWLAVLASLARHTRIIATIWLIAFVICSALSLRFTYHALAKTGDWQRVATFIMTSEQPNEPILVFGFSYTLPLKVYYSGNNPIVALPTYALRDEQQIETKLDSTPGPHALVWLVKTDRCRRENVDLHCPMLEDFIARHFTVVTSRAFYGSSVRLLRPKE